MKYITQVIRALFTASISMIACAQLATASADLPKSDSAPQNTDIAINQGEAKPQSSQPATEIVHSAAELARMQQFLDQRIDREAVRKTLSTHSGRQVDCVDINAQPALQNPALRGHVVELAPKAAPALATTDIGMNLVEPLFETSGDGVTVQAAGCPERTVPVPAITLADLKRFQSLDDYFRKVPLDYGIHPNARYGPQFGLPDDELSAKHDGPTSLHQYAHAFRNVTNWGAKANINVWRPYVELNKEFSLGQIWVTGGSGGGLQTLEVGVQKYPLLYNDAEPHLFIYSTRDGYQRTGCYNNSCRDFVQVSSSIFPGARLAPVSVYNGAQYEIHVEWFKDLDTGHWWLGVQGQWVGYYPRGLYNAAGVVNRAAKIDFGGEILDYRNLNLHTSTDMGSGQFPSAWWQRAAYMRLLRYNYAITLNPPIVWYTDVTGLTTSRSDAMCYDISNLYTNDPNWRSFFFYGGPGFHYMNCR